jgi:hypothetical protein
MTLHLAIRSQVHGWGRPGIQDGSALRLPNETGVVGLAALRDGFNDAALRHAPSLAARQHLPKLSAQGDQPIDLVVDGREMIADERVDLSARILRLVLQGKQGADCTDLKAQFARVPDKYKASDVALTIAAAIAFGPRRRRQEPNLLVKPYG